MTGINNSINNTLQTPFKLGAVSVTSTGTQLNYLSGATSVSGSGALVLNAANSGANSDITSLTGLNGVIQAPTFINDTNGNHILGFSGLSSAVNYLEVQNSRTASGPTLITFGTDSDIDMLFLTKGTGQINLNSANTTRPLIISSGTAFQHATIFDFANTAASRVITFQDATGTLAFAGANSDITSLTGMNGVIQAPTFINDTNGNHILGFSLAASAVNYANIINAATNGGVQYGANGSDTNIDILISPKGTGGVAVYSQAPTQPFAFYSGTSYQHKSTFVVANTAQNRTYALQDASGTLCMDTSSSGSLTTAPPVSASSTLAVGTAYQNTLGYDIVLTVYIAVTAATAASILLGVGPTTTPTQQTIVSSLTTAALIIIPVTIYLPNSYYAKLSTSGTITQTISGQQAMPV